MTIHPNPALDQVTITVLPGVMITGVELIDTQGRVVQHNMARTVDRSIIDVSELPAGLFTARVSTSVGPWQRAFAKLP